MRPVAHFDIPHLARKFNRQNAKAIYLKLVQVPLQATEINQSTLRNVKNGRKNCLQSFSTIFKFLLFFLKLSKLFFFLISSRLLLFYRLVKP